MQESVNSGREELERNTGHLLSTRPFTHEEWTQCRSMEPVNYPWCNKPNTSQQGRYVHVRVRDTTHAITGGERDLTFGLRMINTFRPGVIELNVKVFKTRQLSLHGMGGPDYATCSHARHHKSNTHQHSFLAQGKLQIKSAVTRW